VGLRLMNSILKKDKEEENVKAKASNLKDWKGGK
jgi:hypothetical protein